MVVYPRDLVPLTHTFFNTLYKHYRNETPDTTWDLKLHLSVELLRCVLHHSKHKTIETHQKFSSGTLFTVPSSILIHKTTVPETSRSQAEDILAGLLSGQEENIGWRWREDPMRQKPLKAEWIEEKKRKQSCDVDRVILYVHGGAYCVGSPAQSRFLVNKVVRAAGARAFSVDYRLAPQSPFPAAVIDALAAYLYLIQPPANSGLTPINPSNIVIMGDSAGGGLSLAVMLILRDAGLPQPAACVCWSPWVDLYHSLPSVLENSATDYLPN
ncbi:10818_t:CDS:2, partial [Paraglomus occultum]